jgi:hypothetical protein
MTYFISGMLPQFGCGACWLQVLKHVINQERPDQAQKSDPGMPSSHANSESASSLPHSIELASQHRCTGATALL